MQEIAHKFTISLGLIIRYHLGTLTGSDKYDEYIYHRK
jgi:hypothetical protein